MDSGKRTLTIIPVQTLNPIIPAKLRTIMPYQSVTILLLPFSRFPWFYIYFPSRALSSSAVGGHRAGARRGKNIIFSPRSLSLLGRLMCPLEAEEGGKGASPKLVTSVSAIGWKQWKSRWVMGSDEDREEMMSRLVREKPFLQSNRCVMNMK